MASEPYPVASVIALGEMDKLTRSLLPSIKMAKEVSRSLRFASQLAESSRSLNAIRDSVETVRRLSPLLDPARSLPTVLPTATVDSLAFQESVKRSAALGASFGTLGVVPMTLGRDLARASEMVGQLTKPWADSLHLFRDYQGLMAASARAAEAYVVREVLTEIDDSDLLSGGDVDTRLKRLSKEERDRALAQVEKAIIAVLGITGVATKEEAVMFAGPGLALASAFFVFWIILYRSGTDED